jgi:hypothetical protein
MTTFEYALNVALVGLVALQIRGIKVTTAALLLPVVMTFWAASQVLQSVPTGGNDLLLELGFAAAGCTLGAGAGFVTTLRREGSSAIAKAGAVAAMLWVLGIGARIGFSLWVQHGGAPSVRTFSAAHAITGGPAWGTGFIFMALAEVLCRTSVLYLRTRRSGASIERGGLLRRYAAA